MRPCRLLSLLLALVLVLSLFSGCGTLRSIRENMLAKQDDNAITASEQEDDEKESEMDAPEQTDTTETPERSKQPAKADMYAAYAAIVADREQAYGVGQRSPERDGSEICWMHGVACVRLQDLNIDGVEELLLWENTLTNNNPNIAQIEVWTYANGTAVELYCGSPCFGGDISGQSLELLTRGGETLLVTGTAAGEINLEYYAIRNGKMIRVHTLKDDSDDHTVCNYDEQRISSEEARKIVSASVSLCNVCVTTPGQAAAILRETEQVRQTLGL